MDTSSPSDYNLSHYALPLTVRLFSSPFQQIYGVYGRWVKGRLVNGWLVKGRLVKRTVRQRAVGQTPLQRRIKRETL